MNKIELMMDIDTAILNEDMPRGYYQIRDNGDILYAKDINGLVKGNNG